LPENRRLFFEPKNIGKDKKEDERTEFLRLPVNIIKILALSLCRSKKGKCVILRLLL
jgi:hypothetical protein